jgi:DNA repair photolyase
MLAARQKGNRPGCLCAESRDIGAYDSCPHGCAYCYAVRHRDRALTNYRNHDPAAERLL